MSNYPKDWQKNKIGDIFSTKTRPIVPKDFPNELFRYFSLPNFDSEKNTEKTRGDSIESNKTIFKGKSLLISKLNPRIPRIWLVDNEYSEKCICSTEFIVLNNINSQFELQYFKYLLQSGDVCFYLESIATGSTNSHKRFRPDDLFEFEIQTPSLNEQKKIAKILTSVDRVIELTTLEIDKLKDLKKGMMLELFTKGIGHTKFKDSFVGKIPESWEVVKLGEISIFRNGLNFNSSSTGVGVKVVGVGDFKDYDYPKLDSLSEINPDGVVSTDDYLKENDFIFVRSNGNRQLIGRSMMIKNIRDEKVSFSGFVIRCRLIDKENVFPDFIKHILKSGVIRTAISDEGAGTNISNLNQQILSALNIVLPPRDEQLEISRLLESTNTRIETRKKYLTSLEFMKKGLMNDLLMGKVRVGC
jgi:type I restriction enzyme S subunit